MLDKEPLTPTTQCKATLSLRFRALPFYQHCTFSISFTPLYFILLCHIVHESDIAKTFFLRCTVTCRMVAGHLYHASPMLTVQTGCSTAVAGGMTEQLLMAVLPVHLTTMT